MMFLYYVFLFIFGTIIGSFLNVVLIRHGTGMGLGGRSRCAVTGRVLQWYELIPVVSYLVQGGKARGTSSPLSIQYPLVEIGTGLLFALAGFVSVGMTPMSQGVLVFVFLALVFVFSILIFVYDTRHMIIPHQFVYPLIFLAGISLFVSWNPLTFHTPSYIDVGVGFVFFYFVFLFWKLSNGRAMGFADAKLALAIGWLLGFPWAFGALYGAFVSGAIVGVVLLLSGKATRKTKIPFGPFLLTGLLVTFLYTIYSTLV